MNLKLLNILLGLVLITNAVYTILPFSIDVILTSGGPHGYGLMILPAYSILSICALSAVLVFSKYEKHALSIKKIMNVAFILICIVGLLSLRLFPYAILFTIIPLALSFVFVINWKSTMGYRLLFTNSIFLAEIIIVNLILR